MTIFNRYNLITEQYMIDQDHSKFLAELKDLQEVVNNSVDNGMFSNSFTVLKNSIESLIISTERKIG